VGVLLQALSRKEIDQLKPHLDSLRHSAGFFISDALYQHALMQAKEK
jgi:predicted nucleic acid-binding protein